MRSLLILGGLAVCVLLVTPSRGDRTEDGGGKNGISNLREFIGQNEDGRADVIEAIGQQALPRSRRQEPPETSKPRKRKPCIGCFSSLSVKEDEPRRSKKMKRNKVAGTPPPLPGMFGLVSGPDPDTSRPPRTRGGEGRREKKKKKKNGGKRRRKEKGEGKKKGPHHHPESEKEEKIKRRSGGHSLLTASRYGAREEDLGGGMEKSEGKTRSFHHHPESEKEEEGSWRYGARGHGRSSRYGGRKEDLEDVTEAAERKRRQSDQSKKGRKENKRSGSRSLITAGSPGAQQT